MTIPHLPCCVHGTCGFGGYTGHLDGHKVENVFGATFGEALGLSSLRYVLHTGITTGITGMILKVVGLKKITGMIPKVGRGIVDDKLRRYVSGCMMCRSSPEETLFATLRGTLGRRSSPETQQGGTDQASSSCFAHSEQVLNYLKLGGNFTREQPRRLRASP